MRVLLALTIVTAFALPISAQAGHGGGSGGSGGGSTNKGMPTGAGTTKGATSAHSSTASGAGAVKRKIISAHPSTASGAAAGKGTGNGSSTPKPAAQEDRFLTLDGIQGESADDKHGSSIEISGPSSPSPPPQPHPAPPPK